MIQSLAERGAILETTFNSEPSELDVLDAEVWMSEEVRLVIGCGQHLVGHGVSIDELANTTGDSTTHGE